MAFSLICMAIRSKSAEDMAPESVPKRAFTESTTSEIDADAKEGKSNESKIKKRVKFTMNIQTLGQDRVGARGKSPRAKIDLSKEIPEPTVKAAGSGIGSAWS